MPNCVGPGVEAVQAAVPQPDFNRLPASPQRFELPPRDDSMLPLCEFGDPPIQIMRLL
jgi:hypothetical protein